MVKNFKDIDKIIERHNKTVGTLDDLKLKKYKIEMMEGVDNETVLVAPNGTSITYTDTDMAMFTLGTHTTNPKDWDPTLQYVHRSKMLVMVSSLVKSLGINDKDRKKVLEELFVEKQGYWTPTVTYLEHLRFTLIPENNTLQIYIQIVDKED